MMSPSSQHATQSPKGHKRTPSKDYNDINLRNMTADDFEQVVQNTNWFGMNGKNGRFPGADALRTCFASFEGNRLYVLIAATLLFGLIITIPVIITMPMGGSSNAAPAAGQAESSVPSNLPFEDAYICKSDRRSNGMPLKPHRFICSNNGRYIFGMTNDGKLIYRDINTDLVETYYEGEHGDYFVLETDGTFAVKNKNNEVQWSRANSFEMSYDNHCLEKYPCPYLHLHDGGVLVINFIDEEGTWQTKNFKHTIDVGYP